MLRRLSVPFQARVCPRHPLRHLRGSCLARSPSSDSDSPGLSRNVECGRAMNSNPGSYESQTMTTIRQLTQQELPYRTAELELASFLKARGHKLLSARMAGRFVTFEFTSTAAEDVDSYFGGVEISAREIFDAHRSLRSLIQQVKEHSSQIGSSKSETISNDYRSRPRR